MTCKLSLPRISSQKGKDYWKEVEKKEKKGLWGDWSMRVADGWPAFLVFLPRKLLDLQEFWFLVTKTWRLDALWQTKNSAILNKIKTAFSPDCHFGDICKTDQIKRNPSFCALSKKLEHSRNWGLQQIRFPVKIMQRLCKDCAKEFSTLKWGRDSNCDILHQFPCHWYKSESNHLTNLVKSFSAFSYVMTVDTCCT